MRISTRGEYGVRAMFDLAIHYGKGPIPLRVIAERQVVSEHYLEQLMRSLRQAGLVVSRRGAQGGYELADHPENIRIGDIIRVLEGPITPLDCLESTTGTGGPYCEQPELCVLRGLWRSLQESMEQVLDNTTLEDLRRDAAAMKVAESYAGNLS
ncbi:MAG: Rrf2 family transcriptional regulator [Firmicutes bacterium]|jgi:Rrf2 family cysteine metabolism transcriptional repressor|nr:Rrf2 family transcriptional regulator [Bacillota bacterium]NLO65219.1 Rrf2 family transcriptional regulator [Bacillota bacterium]